MGDNEEVKEFDDLTNLGDAKSTQGGNSARAKCDSVSCTRNCTKLGVPVVSGVRGGAAGLESGVDVT